MDIEISEKIWKFVRGDLDANIFEEWVYQTDVLQSIFSEEFYLELISIDYSSSSKTYELRQKLEKWILSTSDLSCLCISIADTDITHMGSEHEDKVFKTLQETKAYGDPLWWLSLHKCNSCQQNWLIAQDCRHNDIHCFKRITNDVANKITKQNIWTEHFTTFEEILDIGNKFNCSVTFVDPIGSSPLVHTTVDLAKERPGITSKKIATLLNINHNLALKICEKAILDEQADIQIQN